MQEYRANPLAAAVHRWSTRTTRAAQMELARRHPGEYARILWEIREKDRRPEPEAATRAGHERAA
jgi:hypothetical protein